MNATAPTTCARCGAQKREANHWFVIVTNGGGGYWQPFDEFDCAQPGENVSIVCGENCAAKVVSAWFNGCPI